MWNSCKKPSREGLAAWSPLAHYYVRQLLEQVLAVLPITLTLVFTMGVFFNTTVNGGQTAGGIVAAIVGLVLFLDGLRVAFMPLADHLGKTLPQRYPMYVVLMVAFVLGVLVTYAEPAIASLRPLADAVNPYSAKYLFYVLNAKQELLVLSIGLGVGVAAVLGTLRFAHRAPMRPVILMAFVPTITAAFYMQWGDKRLRPLIGLAWDCGVSCVAFWCVAGYFQVV